MTVGIKGVMWKLVENDVFQKEFVSAWGEETFDETEDEHTERLLKKIVATSKKVARKSFFLFDGIDQLDEKRTLGKRGKYFMKLLEGLMTDAANVSCSLGSATYSHGLHCYAGMLTILRLKRYAFFSHAPRH